MLLKCYMCLSQFKEDVMAKTVVSIEIGESKTKSSKSENGKTSPSEAIILRNCWDTLELMISATIGETQAAIYISITITKTSKESLAKKEIFTFFLFIITLLLPFFKQNFCTVPKSFDGQNR